MKGSLGPRNERAILFALGAVYWIAGIGQVGGDSHGPLADAFLHGRLYIDGGPYPILELVPREGGGWWSPFPPFPAITFLPFVPLLQFGFDTNIMSAIVGVIAVRGMYQLSDALRQRDRLLVVGSFAIGSEFAWTATIGGQHNFAHVLAAALFIHALLFGRAGRGRWAGFLLGLAAASRLPVGLGIGLVAYVSHQPIRVVLGVAIPAVLVALYNVARFDSPFEFGYGLIANAAGARVIDEPWYSAGILSIDYLPRGLYTMLLKPFEFSESPPWLLPSRAGTSILLTMPVLLWCFAARGRLALVAGVTAVAIMVPNLLHGNPGYAQFGYRFIVDALPALWVILIDRFRDGVPRGAVVAIAIGIIANMFGVAATATGWNT